MVSGLTVNQLYSRKGMEVRVLPCEQIKYRKHVSYKDKSKHLTYSKEHYWANKESYQVRNKAQRERTAIIIEEAKQSGCALCNEKDSSCLDFHHLGDKDRTISQMRGMNDDRVKAEISKCVILCSNCHRKLHAGKISLTN